MNSIDSEFVRLVNASEIDRFSPTNINQTPLGCNMQLFMLLLRKEINLRTEPYFLFSPLLHRGMHQLRVAINQNPRAIFDLEW